MLRRTCTKKLAPRSRRKHRVSMSSRPLEKSAQTSNQGIGGGRGDALGGRVGVVADVVAGGDDARGRAQARGEQEDEEGSAGRSLHAPPRGARRAMRFNEFDAPPALGAGDQPSTITVTAESARRGGDLRSCAIRTDAVAAVHQVLRRRLADGRRVVAGPAEPALSDRGAA